MLAWTPWLTLPPHTIALAMASTRVVDANGYRTGPDYPTLAEGGGTVGTDDVAGGQANLRAQQTPLGTWITSQRRHIPHLGSDPDAGALPGVKTISGAPGTYGIAGAVGIRWETGESSDVSMVPFVPRWSMLTQIEQLVFTIINTFVRGNVDTNVLQARRLDGSDYLEGVAAGLTTFGDSAGNPFQPGAALAAAPLVFESEVPSSTDYDVSRAIVASWVVPLDEWVDVGVGDQAGLAKRALPYQLHWRSDVTHDVPILDSNAFVLPGRWITGVSYESAGADWTNGGPEPIGYALTYTPPRYQLLLDLSIPELPNIATARPRVHLSPALHIPQLDFVPPVPPVPPPPGDPYADPILIAGASGLVSFVIGGATSEVDELLFDNVSSHTVWFKWTAPVDGTAHFDTADTPPPRWDSALAAYSDGVGIPDMGRLLDSDDDGHLQPGVVTDDGFGTSQVDFACVTGDTYYVQVNSWDYPAGLDGMGGPGTNPSAGYPRSDCRLRWSVT